MTNNRCNGLTEFHAHVSRERYAPTVIFIANRLLAPVIARCHCSPCFHESIFAGTAPMPKRISRSDSFRVPRNLRFRPTFATVTFRKELKYSFCRFHGCVPDKRVVLVIDEIKISITFRDMRRTLADRAP